MRQLTSFQQNKAHYRNYLLLLIICLLAYWPLTFGIFSVKNDAIHYFLPYRFNISEAIRNGEWPFWSPYIYLGNPVYGDMQSGAWNPVVWLFSLISRYDITVFHYENLFYIFLGGVGMYKLTNRLVENSRTALLIAVSYMLSGFMLSGQLINWLAAAAFFPFVIHYYLKTLHTNSMGNAAKSAIALFFLFTAGYPSFFIITVYILLMLFILSVIKKLKNKTKAEIKWKNFILQHILLLIVFAALSLPAIISYIDLLPYYQRGNGISYPDAVHNSFEWQHLLSLFFPSSIKTNDVVSSTDVTCRNVYPGIFALLILASFPPKINRRNILLLLLIILSFLFSLGDVTPIRKLCYDIIPLMDTFRHPSQMRLFILFGILLLAAPGIKELLEDRLSGKKIKMIAWIMTGAIFLITILAFINSNILKESTGLSFATTRDTIKKIIENISLADTVFINGLIQFLFLAAFLFWIAKFRQNKKVFSWLWVVNIFIMAQLLLPITFVSSVSPKEINALIHTSPKGFPAKELEKTIGENSKDATAQFDKIALSYFYNKKIGLSHISYSPSFLEEQDMMLNSNTLYNYILSKPVVYIADSVLQLNDTALLNQPAHCNYLVTDGIVAINGTCLSQNNAFIRKISANSFEVKAHIVPSSFLVLTQSFHQHWKVWIDGQNGTIYKANTAFMGIFLQPGDHTIIFRFVPGNTKKAIWVMLSAVIILLLGSIVSLIRHTDFRQE